MIMTILKKTYNAGGFRIAIAADEQHFIRLLDDYFWTELPRSYGSPMRVTINISGRELPVYPGKSRKNIISYEDSLIDVSRRMIYDYCPDAPYPDQVGMLFRPLSSLMIYMGYYPIHGALSRAGMDFVAILGPSGCGKSTISGNLALRGFSLLCDDCFFIKKVADGFTIIPFYKRLNVKNISDRDIFRAGFSKPQHIKASYTAKRFNVIFTQYSAKRDTGLTPLTRKAGALRLIGGNMALETGHPDNEATKRKMLKCLMQFEKSSTFYKLTYKDRCLRKACSDICHVLGKRYEPRRKNKK